MNLDELAATAGREAALPAPSPHRAPDWALGCFRRRAITFCTGATDRATHVTWLQSHGLTADLRVPADRPPLSRGAGGEIWDAAPELLVALADVDGGLARTSWDAPAGVMTWSDWTSFQLHDRWPEPGKLARIGDCLIELAPSGAYVEDWRLMPSPPGPLIGLRLIEERDVEAGIVRHRGGGLVVCGQHAAFVRGRPAPLTPTGAGAPAARLAAFVRAHLHDRLALRAIFGFEASIGTRAAGTGSFTVTASTNPLREGAPLLRLDGFAHDRERGLVVQRTREDGRAIERLFSVDTLEARFAVSLATPATSAAHDWLAREASTLLAAAHTPSASADEAADQLMNQA